MILTRRNMIIGSAALSLLPAGPLWAGPETQAISGAAFGSTWRLVLASGADANRARRAVETTVALVDATMSPWRADSEVALFNASQSTGWQAMSAATLAVTREALDIARLTGGAFDPTVGPLVARYGFGPITGAPAQVEALEQGANALRKTNPGLTLDLCGIAKGHALDQAAAALKGAGITDALLEMGGEVLALGTHPSGRAWQVAIEQPGAQGFAVHRIIAPRGLALATSGHAPQGYNGPRASTSHLINPATKRPAAGPLAAVSVLAASGQRADALATALTVLGPEHGPALARRLGIAALFLTRRADGLDETMTAAFADHIIA